LPQKIVNQGHIKGSFWKPRPPTPAQNEVGKEVNSSQVVAELSRSMTSAELSSPSAENPPTTSTLKKPTQKILNLDY
jgi:hypothetical protein